MSTQLKLRRGTTAQHSTFTGAEGEVTVDTTKDTLVVHDGTTAGGVPLATEASKVSKTGDTMTGDLVVAAAGTRKVSVNRTGATTAGAIEMISGDTQNVLASTGAKDIGVEINGTEVVRFKSGGGIKFPGTQLSSADANTLDDYEEGTFTPSFTGTNLTSLSLNYAQYTKIGRLVTLLVSINVTVTSSNTLTYVNMAAPFTAGAATVGSAFLNNNVKSGTSQISGTSLYAFFSAASAPTAGAEIIQLSITYQV